MNIAVLVDNDGSVLPFANKGKIMIYDKQKDGWKIVKDILYDLEQEKGLAHMRNKISKLVTLIGYNSKVFIATKVIGIPYFEFEKQGFSVWEIEGRPEDFLDEVMNEENLCKEESVVTAKISVPEKISDGCFAISIKSIQENTMGITSKQVLQGFVRKSDFRQLVINCNHVPPWLQAEVIDSSLRCQIEKIDINDYKIILVKE